MPPGLLDEAMAGHRGTSTDYRGFIHAVGALAEIPDDEAERAARATLHTLAERLSPGEARDIAARVPGELREELSAGEEQRRFHVDEFLRRVAERADLDQSAAERDAKAVLAALWSVVGAGEFADMRSELPKDFQPLLDEAQAEAPPLAPADLASPALPVATYDDVLDRVELRMGGADRRVAERAAEAVVEVLAGRISHGQADDLDDLLPAQLGPAIQRGRRRNPGGARPVPPRAFAAEVARLEGIDVAEAEPQVVAVLATLRDVVPRKEWSDTERQLDKGLRRLLSHA